MMDEQKKAKIEKFLNDQVMAETIFGFIRDSFLKSRPQKEVHYLAAKSLSVEFLEEAKRDLIRHKNSGEDDDKTRPQVGL